MTATTLDLELRANEDRTLTFPCKDDNDSTIDLTGYTATFALKRNTSDASAVLSVNGSIPTPANGTIVVALTNTQTASWHGNYVYEVRTTKTGDGTIETRFKGYVIVDGPLPATSECLYCTPDDVAAILRLTNEYNNRKKFDATTDPSYDEVLNYIRYAMSEIEQSTKDSWREQSVTDYYYSIPNPYYAVYPRYVVIPLKHRNIVRFTSIKVFKGGDGVVGDDFDDWVLEKHEGRGRDYYYDRTKGVLYMKWLYPWYIGQNALLLSYVYGNGVTYTDTPSPTYSYNIPYDIKQACAKLAAITILENDFERAVLVDGMSFDPSRSRMVDRWRDDVQLILKRRTVWGTVGLI